MNKLRLIKIYELRGKVHPIEKSIIAFLDNIEVRNENRFIYYMKNDAYYFGYDTYEKHITLFTITKFGFMEELISCPLEERESILIYLISKHMKLSIKYF